MTEFVVDQTQKEERQRTRHEYTNNIQNTTTNSNSARRDQSGHLECDGMATTEKRLNILSTNMINQSGEERRILKRSMDAQAECSGSEQEVDSENRAFARAVFIIFFFVSTWRLRVSILEALNLVDRG